MFDKVLFDRIAWIVQKNQKINHKLDVLQALNEELGEYTRATRIEDGIKKGVLIEPAKVEVIDLLIAGIEAYIVAGGTYEEMDDIIEKKLAKWEAQNGI